MQPYLICLDLDGTLLNDNFLNYTKQVLTDYNNVVTPL